MSLVKSSATRLDSASTWLSSVMSWTTTTTSVTLPLLSRRVVAFSNTVNVLPDFDLRTNSKLAVPFPASASCKTSSTYFLGRESRHLSCLSVPFCYPELQIYTEAWGIALSMRRDKSSATRSCSLVTSRICVMSWPSPITPVTSSFGPRRVVAFSKISRRSPNW